MQREGVASNRSVFGMLRSEKAGESKVALTTVLPVLESNLPSFQQLRFGVFREGVFQKMPALEGQFLKEISVRFAGENHLRTQKTHKTKLCAEVPERPLPKDPFFQLLILALSYKWHGKEATVTIRRHWRLSRFGHDGPHLNLNVPFPTWWTFRSQFLTFQEEHSMDQYRSRLKLSENFERHWSIPISGEIHMDQSLVHTFSWGNSYGPMVLNVL